MNTKPFARTLFLSAAAALLASGAPAADKPGYTDTPIITGQKWRVHDAERPQPRVVTPGARFSEMAAPPADAIVLFDGQDLSKWSGDEKNPWKVENGYLEVAGKGSIQTREQFGDFQLHLEFAAPEVVKGHSQERGNSGVIIYNRYEVQVLDGFENSTYADGTVGAMYGQFPPLVNAARKPGAWQTYDIIFESARWDAEGKLLKPANVTVLLNGLVLHHKQNFIGYMAHRELARYSRPHPPRGPIQLQHHGNPVRYRNIWLRPLGEYDQP
jgi:hypothetical protein